MSFILFGISERIRCVFGVKVPDANAPYRLMKREILEKYMQKIPNNYRLPNMLITTFCVFYDKLIRYDGKNIVYSDWFKLDKYPERKDKIQNNKSIKKRT